MAEQNAISPTNKNLLKVVSPLLAKWLINYALKRDRMQYGKAKYLLENQFNFSSLGRATKLGLPAGALMHHIAQRYPEAPLLNVLLVLKETGLPSVGAGSFLSAKYDIPELAESKAHLIHKELWKKFSLLEMEEVWNYPHWPEVYQNVFGKKYKDESNKEFALSEKSGTEKDGKQFGGGGEGKNHKNLRLFVQNNPDIILEHLGSIAKGNLRSETEESLKSGDQVDVVYYDKLVTYVIEVKSRDSNAADFERGVYQCVKYKHVMDAIIDNSEHKTIPVLLTETDIPKFLKTDISRLKIKHIQVSKER